MQIKTISMYDPQNFEKEVNSFLKQGWELHGTPAINSVSELHTWDGDKYSRIKTIYVQVLKKP
jgi:hypothetical protein